MEQTRALDTIARDILKHWPTMLHNGAAAPYVRAMLHLNGLDDKYLLDDGRDIVTRFLCNAGTFRGKDARRIKDELKAMLKAHKKGNR